MSYARFPKGKPIFDGNNKVIMFPAILGNNTINCKISSETLANYFENDPQKPISVFSDHRSAIVNVADKLIAENRYENDGSIFIRTTDF